jgi:hypothetical protein
VSRHRQHSHGRIRPSRASELAWGVVGALVLAASVLLPGPVVQLLKGMP